MPTINSDPHSGSRLQKLITDLSGAFASLFTFRTRTLLVHVKNLSGRYRRTCPICSFDGYFHAFGSPLRWDAKCTQCGSLERHRQFWLWLSTSSIPKDSSILHFAPEAVISSRLRTQYTDYKTADLYADHVDLKIDIEKIALPSNSVEVVICMHVLEHVNTEVALSELQRIVKPGGMALIMVPLVPGLPISYRNENVTSRSGRELYFGQFDHSVLLGDDFQSMITNAGFNIEKHVAEIESCVKHSLTPGEILFICRKS